MASDVYGGYWRAVRGRLPVLLLLSAAAAAAAWAVVSRLGPVHTVHYSYLVSLSEREKVGGEFRFDGYYALSATDLFADTLAAWVETPQAVAAAYGKAGLPLPSTDAGEVAESVSAQKMAPQLVAVAVKHKSKSSAQKLAAGLRQVMDENVELYHSEEAPSLKFKVVTTDSWTGRKQIEQAAVVPSVFIFTLLLGVNAVLLAQAFRSYLPADPR